MKGIDVPSPLRGEGHPAASRAARGEGRLSLGVGARVAVVALLAALLACGVKAPPRPPETAGVAGSKHDLRPGAPDGGAAGGEAAPPDGGSERP
jgi:hypothetical protein